MKKILLYSCILRSPNLTLFTTKTLDILYILEKIGNKSIRNYRIQKQDGASAEDDQVQGLEKWTTLDVLGQPAELYVLTIGVITSFHFMVQEDADVSIQ